MILGISSCGMWPQFKLHGQTSAYHACPGYSALYAKIALVIVSLRSCKTCCGRSAIIGGDASVAAVAGLSEFIVHATPLALASAHASAKVACPIDLTLILNLDYGAGSGPLSIRLVRTFKTCDLSNVGSFGHNELWPRIDSLCSQKCCDLRTQQTQMIYWWL